MSMTESTRNATQPAVGQEVEFHVPPEDLQRLGAAARNRLRTVSTAESFLLRAADPPLAQVYVEPTTFCNLNCRICVRKTWDEPTGFMPMETYHRLICGLRQMPTVKRVNFWGIGEPLLHPKIVTMVALAKEMGAETQLITNGLLLNRTKAERLVNAGLDRLIVSIDSVSPEPQPDIRSGDELAKVRQNLDYFRELTNEVPCVTVCGTTDGHVNGELGADDSHKPEIGLAFVLTKSNLHELKQLRSLAFSLGASSITLTNILPYSEELQDEILYTFSAGRSYPLKPSYYFPEVSLPRMDVSPNLFNALPALLGFASSIGGTQPAMANKNGYCRFVEEGSIAVNWQGDVSPCIPLMHSYTCYILGREKHIRRCKLGNLNQIDLDEIWNSAEFIRIRDTVRRFPFSPCTDCGGCDLGESNEQDCQGNTFPVCGDCLWAKGVIQCP